MITSTYDDANRLTGRTIVRGTGVVGPTTESYALDGLNRVTSATSGSVSTALAYDSASRQISETTLGRTVAYGYDKVHNRIKTTYPSGHVVDVAIDPLDRPDTVTVAGQPTPAVDYGYRGPHLRQGATYGNGLVQSSTFDATWRPTKSTAGLPSSIHPAFEETLAWSPRSLKTAVGRGDASGRGFVLGHDAAQRVTRAALTGAAAATPNNSVPDLPADPARAFDYAYDLAQNLVARTSENAGAESPYGLPTDSSGRNRPASAGGAALGYDPNGNRTTDGGKQLSFDFRNRLTEVRDAGGALIASYSYDAFNRRVRKDVVGEAVEEMVYAGWQELERYTGGALDQRYTRGAGIDEMVRMEADVDENGSLETAWTPLYDHTGNLAKLTDPTGKVVASYDLSPFGEAFEARSDLVAPEAQLLAVDPVLGSITLNFDHEARLDETAVLIEDLTPPGQSLAMPGGKSGGILDRSISRPVSDGPVAGRRFEIMLATVPTEGAPMRLTVPAAALVDRFGNPLAEDLVVDFTWPATAGGILVLDDTAPPEIERIRLDQGHVEITLSEPPASGAASAISISEDPSAQVVAMTWSLQSDGHTLRTDSVLPDGYYLLDVDSLTPVDLDGKGLAVSFQQAFEVPGAGDVQIPFEQPDPTLVPPNAFVNRFAFHGRPVDEETGYVYFRNRYFDPKTGRFVSADPMGFVDGPSGYQFAGYSPFNFGDPLGLEVKFTAVDGNNQFASLEPDDISFIEKEILAFTGVEVSIDPSSGIMEIRGATQGVSATALSILEEMIASSVVYETRLYHSSGPGLGSAYHREEIVRIDLDDVKLLRFSGVEPETAGLGSILMHEFIHLHYDLHDPLRPVDKRMGIGATVVLNNKIRRERGFTLRGPSYNPPDPSGRWARSTVFMNDSGEIVGGAFHPAVKIMSERSTWEAQNKICQRKRQKAAKRGQPMPCELNR